MVHQLLEVEREGILGIHNTEAFPRVPSARAALGRETVDSTWGEEEEDRFLFPSTDCILEVVEEQERGTTLPWETEETAEG